MNNNFTFAIEISHIIKMKKVVIIGASSGIGEALAKEFASPKYEVAIAARRIENLKKLKEEYPQVTLFRAIDITSEGCVTELSQLIAELGGMDILLLTAGVGWRNPSLDEEKELHTIDVNCTGFTRILLYAYQYFCQKGYGTIAATSSIAGFRGLDLCPAYSASKAFELSYLESLRRKSKTERKNIKIISLIPGFVNTAMGQGAGVFWRCEPEVAAQQIRKGIEQKKEIIYITKRWRIVAWLMKRIPNYLFENIAFRTKG